ncbi:unnamed protein product [Spirodela intermedia]|uniref:MLO-like protein n=1 Tax=Spirodela intermedia TaxID=51605 RepID=A0A7I8JS06_SPIIN|nr:unnamed protein product [Spirodela intermedia]CAA6672968.1 unnamed protein product [Spirodela intermedia]
MAGGSSLETTPTWAVAAVSCVFILVAVLVEHALHLLSAFLERRKRKTLNRALYHIQAELRSFGFMSLVLNVAQQPISKICIPEGVAESFLPCEEFDSSSDSPKDNSCPEGRVPLLSTRGTDQLLLLIFMLAASHVLTSLLTFGLMMAKMKKWESWKRRLKLWTTSYPRRFTLARETSFGRRHLQFWRDHRKLLWIGCFLRQFGNSVSKADYLALRHGFIMTHFPQNQRFDFRKFLRKSLDHDFSDVAGISHWSWTYAILFIFSNAHGFYSHFWLPILPLMILLIVGTKLELTITRLCLESSSDDSVLPGTFWVRPNDSLFWFRKPRWILHTIHFIMFQNAFQLAVFVWTWTEDIALSMGVGGLVQILCAYVTLPLYALVSRVGSSKTDTIFTEEVVKGLRNWRRAANRRNLVMTGQNSGSFYPAEPESVSSSTSSPSPYFRSKETTDEPEESPPPPAGRSLSISETSTDPGEPGKPEEPSMEITAEEEDQQTPPSSDIPPLFERCRRRQWRRRRRPERSHRRSPTQ